MSEQTSPERPATHAALAEKAKTFPEGPGVYLMLNSSEKTIYIG